MDGCTEFKTTAEEFPGAVAVMDSFHVAGKASNKLPRRIQQAIPGTAAARVILSSTHCESCTHWCRATRRRVRSRPRLDVHGTAHVQFAVDAIRWHPPATGRALP
jgi:hypothetical protein